MSEKPWYKRYPSDFVAGTMMLTAEEKGVYGTLIDLMYDQRRRIKDDAQWLARVSGCTTRRFNQIKIKLAGIGKITLHSDGYISNPRFDREHGVVGDMPDAGPESAPQTPAAPVDNSLSGHADKNSADLSPIFEQKNAAKNRDNLDFIHPEKSPASSEHKGLTSPKPDPVRARARSRDQIPEKKEPPNNPPSTVQASAPAPRAPPARHDIPKNLSLDWLTTNDPDFVALRLAYAPPRNSAIDAEYRSWVRLQPDRPSLQFLLACAEAYCDDIARQSKGRQHAIPKQNLSTWLKGRIFQNYAAEVELRIAAKARAAAAAAARQQQHDETMASWGRMAVPLIAKIGQANFDRIFVPSKLVIRPTASGSSAEIDFGTRDQARSDADFHLDLLVAILAPASVEITSDRKRQSDAEWLARKTAAKA